MFVVKFHMYLYERQFTLITDNQPFSLLRILGPILATPMLATACLQRWAIILSAYQYDISLHSSQENVCADALSRLLIQNGPSKSKDSVAKEEEAFQFVVHQMSSLLITASRIAKETRKD